jgi:hypothetical protein
VLAALAADRTNGHSSGTTFLYIRKNHVDGNIVDLMKMLSITLLVMAVVGFAPLNDAVAHPADPPIGQKAGRQFAGEALRRFFQQRWTRATHRSLEFRRRVGQRLRYAYSYVGRHGMNCGSGYVTVWRLPRDPRRGWSSITGDTVCS